MKDHLNSLTLGSLEAGGGGAGGGLFVSLPFSFDFEFSADFSVLLLLPFGDSKNFPNPFGGFSQRSLHCWMTD